MAFTRLRLHRGARELCVSNLHASAGQANSELAEEEVIRAAECSVEWAGDSPLVFGGDLNLRPADSKVFAQLAKRFGLKGPTAPDSLDHLLVRGLRTATPVSAWDPREREVTEDGLAIRLSDHAPVEATLEFGRARGKAGAAPRDAG